MDRVLAFAREEENEKQMNFDFLVTSASLEKYLGYPPTGRSGNVAQLKKKSTAETSRRVERGKGVMAEPPRRNVANKGKSKVAEPTPQPPTQRVEPAAPKLGSSRNAGIKLLKTLRNLP